MAPRPRSRQSADRPPRTSFFVCMRASSACVGLLSLHTRVPHRHQPPPRQVQPHVRTPPRQRIVTLAALGSLILGAVVAGNGLVSCASDVGAPTPRPSTRPVTPTEAARLAGVRLADYTAGHAGIHITIGTGANAAHLTGWVDWRAPLVY